MQKVLYLNHSLFIMLKCMIWKLFVVMCFKIAWPLHSLIATFHTFSNLFCFFPETEFQTSNFKRPLYWSKGPVYKPLNCNQINWICMVPWARCFSKLIFVLTWVSQFCILSLYFPLPHLNIVREHSLLSPHILLNPPYSPGLCSRHHLLGASSSLILLNYANCLVCIPLPGAGPS